MLSKVILNIFRKFSHYYLSKSHFENSKKSNISVNFSVESRQKEIRKMMGQKLQIIL